MIIYNGLHYYNVLHRLIWIVWNSKSDISKIWMFMGCYERIRLKNGMIKCLIKSLRFYKMEIE